MTEHDPVMAKKIAAQLRKNRRKRDPDVITERDHEAIERFLEWTGSQWAPPVEDGTLADKYRRDFPPGTEIK